MAKEKKKGKSSYSIFIIILVIVIACVCSSVDSDDNTSTTSKAVSSTTESVEYTSSKQAINDKSNKKQKNKETTSANLSNDYSLSVYYIDVGQGDCEFITLPDNKCMLIDAGERDNAQQIISKIKALGYDKLDYVICTHPHSDHVGSMSEIINSIDVECIYMPKATTDTRTYERLLKTISNNKLKINTAIAGKIICETESYSASFLSPISSDYEELNNYSAVVKLTYGSSSYLFTGDAEKIVEQEMIDNLSSELNIDVLKVGHHGSKYSSSIKFLAYTSPDYAVISCGEGNSYDHPHKDALNRLKATGAKIYRTDQDSDIRISTNGDGNYNVQKNCFG